MTKIHLQSTYSDIVSDGGLDPRNEYEKKFKQKPLTEEEIIENCDTWVLDDIGGQEVIKIVRRTELHHGIGVEDEPDSSVT
jgi:hypothetical protein